MDDLEVSELVAQARKGSAEAYDELIRRYSTGLFGYVYRCVGNHADAEELLQDIFLRMVRGLRTYREQEKFKVWLYRLAHNRIVDHWRRRRPIPMSDQSENDPIGHAPGRETNPAVAADQAEQVDRLQQALEHLSPEQRETLLLRYFGGVRFEQIAKMTGCPIGTALARAHRGLAKLKNLLAEKENEND